MSRPKGFRHSESTKKKMRDANKGKKHTDEFKKKASERMMGKKYFKGNKHTKEVKEIISELMKGNQHSKGNRHTEELRKRFSEERIGGKNQNWKGGITPENKKIRNSIETRLWREAIFARDNYTCQKTGIKGGKIEAHHIQNFAEYLELRFAIDNGVTLSEKSHSEFHKIYGRKNNSKKQLDEFLKDLYEDSGT